MASRLIEAQFIKRVRDNKYTLIHERECEHCHKVWETTEIPIAKEWTGTDPGHCPWCGNESKTIDTIGASAALGPKPRKISAAVLIIARNGGRYRRRQCAVCGQRWTTAEFRRTGHAHPPADECSSCNGTGED